MSRKIQRDTHKRVSSTGYQKMQGDLEVQGHLLGPAIDQINAAIAKVSAVSTTPVKLAAPQLEGIMRGVSIRWSRQYNLSNFSHYELQVSDDDESWYSLLLDGSGWKGNLNEDTDSKVESFTHANIPLREDAGDLVGIPLYYRVRQATLSGTWSDWSDSAYTTTKGVQDVVLTDSRNRYIEISSKKGIYADDRQGHVIHDIPNAPILTDMIYGGHIIFREYAGIGGTILLQYTDVSTSRDEKSATVNTDISSSMPEGLTNPKGILAYATTGIYAAAAKITTGTLLKSTLFYSTTYNAIPNNPTIVAYRHAEGAGVIMESGVSSIIPLPITWNAGIPYITWCIYMYFPGMLNGNALYYAAGSIYVMGYLV